MNYHATGKLTDSSKRFDRSSWITLSLALAILVSGVLVTAAAYNVPADGWIVDRGFFGRYINPVYLVSEPAVNSELESSDILLEVDGVPFELLEAQAAQLRPRRPENWESGETVLYRIQRDGSELEVPVSLQQPPFMIGYRPPILLTNLDILSSFITLFVGVLLFVMRPRQRAAQLIFLLGISLVIVDLMNFGVPAGAADLFSSAVYWPRLILGDLSWFLVIWPIIIHLFLIFPEPKKVVVYHSFLIPAIYATFIGASLLYFVLSVQGFDFLGMNYAAGITTLAVLILGIILVHSLLTIKDPVGRMQMRWIFFGGFIGIVSTVLIGLVLEFTLQEYPNPAPGVDPVSFLLELVSLLLSAALPISLAVAVLRYRLWDIEIIINRSLVYGSLTVLLALIYFGSVVLLEGIFRSISEQGSPIAIVISTLVIAGLFSPLRRRVQEFIDRRFYRRKYDAEKILGRFAESARDETDLKRLTDELYRVAKSSMQAEHVSIWLKDTAGRDA